MSLDRSPLITLINREIDTLTKQRLLEIEEKHRTERNAKLNANPQFTGAEVRQLYDDDLAVMANEMKEARAEVREQVVIPLQEMLAEKRKRRDESRREETQRNKECQAQLAWGGLPFLWKKLTETSTQEADPKSTLTFEIKIS